MTRAGTRGEALLAALFAAVLLAVVIQGFAQPRTSFFGAVGLDFRAFYCSGEAVAHGRSPYLVEPLRSCEHRVQWSNDWSRDLVIPSPLPAYDLALLAALSRLPYDAAKAVWFCGLLACIVLATGFLARLTKLPTLFVLLCVLGGGGVLCLLYGQLPPVVVAALAGGAYFAQRGKMTAAAIALGASMIEPHVGLAACLAAFLLLPACRLALATTLAVLAVAGVATVGVPTSIVYFTQVLPAQAAAELVATDQYSLSHVLHVLGFPDRAALLGGSACYLVMLVVGVLLARRVSASTGSVAFVPLIPAALAIFGGSYIHEEQFLAAIPAALALAALSRAARPLAWVALGLLGFSWLSFADGRHASDLAIIGLSLGVAAWIGVLAAPERRRVVTALAAACVFVVAVFAVRALPGPRTVASDAAFPRSVSVASASASANWAAYLRAAPTLSVPSPRSELGKAPSWLALILLAVVCWRAPRGAVGDGVPIGRKIDDGASFPRFV